MRAEPTHRVARRRIVHRAVAGVVTASLVAAVAPGATAEPVAGEPVAGELVAGEVIPNGSPEPFTSGALVINELYYHPVDDNPAGEFLELLNPGGAALDVSGWCVTGVSYCFPEATSVAAGAFVVLRPGQYTGSLSNSGERIRLLDASTAVVDSVEYDDRGVWPALADGDGPSLERRDPASPGDDPGNWMSGSRPTPGAPNSVAAAGLLPVFSDVTHSVLPAPDQSTDVSARLAHAGNATLHYRIDFGVEQSVSMVESGGTYSASIPPQPAGSLVRYRLSAVSDDSLRTGTWPRQGDGSTYSGTTVAQAAASGLPRFEWFIPDADYATAYRDLSLYGDDGYPSVFAYDGVIFDNTLVRVKGSSSRTAVKKKWKFSLPAGHDFAVPGLLPVPVDEFSLDTAGRDDSYIRDILASELMTEAGVVGTQQMFPVRLERNGDFYGLYAYTEQSDGAWRDRYGLDDEGAIIYEVGDRRADGRLSRWHLQFSRTLFRLHYGKETVEYADDREIRALISALGRRDVVGRRTWLTRNVDLPQVINALAASAVLQSDDFGARNFRLVLGASGRWRVIPNDFDATLGVTRLRPGDRPPYGLRILPSVRNIENSALVDAIIEDPVLGPLYRRRLRTLSESLLDPAMLEARAVELLDAVRADALLDQQVWPSATGSFSIDLGVDELLTYFGALQRRKLLVTLPQRTEVPSAQRAVPLLRISAVGAAPPDGAPEWIEIHNPNATPVDISGWSIRPIGFTAPPGTVVGARARVRFVSDITADAHPSVSRWFVPAAFEPGLPDVGGRLDLLTANGDWVHSLTYGTPEPPAPLVIVNEINAVADDKLPADGADAFWGSTPTGNGKDWIELVVVSDHTDLRGWRVQVRNDGGDPVVLTLPDDIALADVRAGTILTISEQLASDLTVDPGAGDWWINVQLTGFDTSNSNTQVAVLDAEGVIVFGPVGEGINPLSGVGSDELAALNVSPSALVTASSPYRDAKVSSFGAPNALAAGGTQDFSVLRTAVIRSDDVTPPSPVSSLTVVPAGARRALVTWTESSDDVGVAGYRIFVNGRLIGETSEASFATPLLADAVALMVEVVARDESGNQSAPTARSNVVLADVTPPPPVRRLGGTIGARTMRLSWSASPDPAGIAYYEVEREGAVAVRTRAPRLFVGGLQSATWYTVRVRAVDRAGNTGLWVERRFRTR